MPTRQKERPVSKEELRRRIARHSAFRRENDEIIYGRLLISSPHRDSLE